MLELRRQDNFHLKESQTCACFILCCQTVYLWFGTEPKQIVKKFYYSPKQIVKKFY